MFFRDIRHQDRAIGLIRAALESGRMPHALLFHGPDGVGKELTASALAARLLCKTANAEQGGMGLFGAVTPGLEPCGECESCRLFTSGNHPDFQRVTRGLRKFHSDPTVRKSKGLFLVVDVVRQFLIEPASRLPTISPRRVFIIREAERMNEEAQNALLKTLEEPPGNACLILISSSASRLLPTIRSRCAQIEFARLPRGFVVEQLRALARLNPADADWLADLCDGRLGVALQRHAAGLLEQRPALAEAWSLADRPVAFGQSLLAAANELGGRLADLAEAEDNAAAGVSPLASAAPPRGSSTGDADTADDDASDDDSDEAGSTGKSRGGGSSKAPATDIQRDALRVVFAVLSNEQRARLRENPSDAFDDAEAAIAAVSRAEWMLERNVAPQLVCEALAVGA